MSHRVKCGRYAVLRLMLWVGLMLRPDSLSAAPPVAASSEVPVPLAPLRADRVPRADLVSADGAEPRDRLTRAAGDGSRRWSEPPEPKRSGTGQLPPEPIPDSAHSTRGQLPNAVIGSARAHLPQVLGPPVAPRACVTLPDAPPPTSSSAPASAAAEVSPVGGSAGSSTIEPGPLVRTAVLGRPTPSAELVPAQAVERLGIPPVTPPRPDPVQEIVQQRSTLGGVPVPSVSPSATDTSTATTTRFGERLSDILHQALGNTQDLFKSDHVFDNFISPVTHPFLLEDPRSLTEFRPLFIFQKVPRSQPDFRGGGLWFFGGQARVALTDRISLVIHKLGGLSINTGNASLYDGSTGFSELWLGPKYTLIRNDQSGSVLATGLQFQIPIGTRSVYQDTGSLSLVPYLSYAQNWDFGWRIGSLNTIIGTGYSFSVTAERSDYYYLSAQVDLDTFNNHRFYPLLGLNWQIVTANGKERPFFGAEGRDLFNLGGLARGRGLMTWAVGARYKISEAAQLGGAFELPIAGPRDFFSYRFTVDFILRY